MKKRAWIFIAAGAALLAAASVFVVAAVLEAKTLKVAFYGIDERVQNGVKREIDKSDLRRVRYYVLNKDEGLPKNFNKKYSILIMKNSLDAKMNADKFIPIDEKIFDALPISIRKATLSNSGKERYGLPLLLDHFEIAYYQGAQNDLGLKAPQSYGGLLRYLEALQKKVEIPLVCAGATDRDLLGFVSAMSEILYGAEDYKKMLLVLHESSSLNKANLPEALTRVLDEIKAMQQKGILFPRWTKVTPKDIRYFMQERKLGATAMYLSERRDVEYNLIKYYDSFFFPRYDNRAAHGVIAPQIAAFLLSPKKEASQLLVRLVSADVQAELSNLSLLAPVASRAEAVDRQADDVRFWAASSSEGALGGIEEECETSEERRHLLAQKIRAYLEN